MPLVMARPRLITLNSNGLTDHNRSEMSIDLERIETRNRMANGSLRKYYVADKRTFSVSWNETPKVGSQTVDGFWSGAELNTFYNSMAGQQGVTLGVTGNTGPEVTYTVVITEFSYTIKKRWKTWELWDFSLTMEEV